MKRQHPKRGEANPSNSDCICKGCGFKRDLAEFYFTYLGYRCRSCRASLSIGTNIRHNEISRLYMKKAVSECKDYYIKKLLPADATHDMVELKRQAITMKRTLKQFKQWRKEQENEPDYTNVYGEQHTDEENHEGRISA